MKLTNAERLLLLKLVYRDMEEYNTQYRSDMLSRIQHKLKKEQSLEMLRCPSCEAMPKYSYSRYGVLKHRIQHGKYIPCSYEVIHKTKHDAIEAWNKHVEEGK